MLRQNTRKNSNYIWAIFILSGIILNGCAIGPKPIKKLISPSQAEYDEAGVYFKQKNYTAAIAAYEKFIKDYPSHKLVSGAYLGLAWSKYILADYNKALEYLTQVRAQDADLKGWIEKLSDDCKKRIAGSKEAGSTPTLFNVPEFTNEEKIKIEGALTEGSKIVIDNEEVKIENGLFSQEIILNAGENVIAVSITDKEGKTETKQLKVTLDEVAPVITVTSAELDDSGYVQFVGQTEKGAKVFAEGEALLVAQDGKFSGQIKLPHNKQIKLTAEDRAGNASSEVFSDTDYPGQPSGLRVRSVYSSSADLEWNSNRESDIKGYNVYYTLPGTFSDSKKNTEVIKDTKYTVSGLLSGNTYTLYIRAVDKMGNESQTPSASVNAVIP